MIRDIKTHWKNRRRWLRAAGDVLKTVKEHDKALAALGKAAGWKPSTIDKDLRKDGQ